MFSKYSLFILSVLFTFSLTAQQVKKSVYGAFLLKNGTVHSVTKGTFISDVLIKDGIISEIGNNLSAGNAKVIDCTGKHIYPGFIDSGTRLGLAEIGAVSVTNDYNELGDFIPHMKALTAVNPNSVSIPVTRVNGVTTVLAKPEGGRFPGTAALIDLHGYTPEQMYAGFEGVLMNYPSTGKRGRWDRRSDEDIKKDADKAVKKLDEIWDLAVQYAAIDSAGKVEKKTWNNYNPQMDALLPVVRGESSLFVEVNSKSDIESAIEWVTTRKIKAVFTGVAEGWRLADQLAKAKIDVITGPVLSIPGRDNDRYDAAYTNASKMQKAGVNVALRTNDAENVRNLPFNAGFAAAYGMGIEEALKSITIIPAKIFGVDSKLGSIEKSKIANLFVSDGDPFETKTKIEHLFIRGWNVPLESRHTLLYDEFLQRDPGLK
ncbi:MAG: amidohydrolase family protein [Saprospiraceae bacterium]|nr:amidohydrolase family protein [Saprospiraceae bacterium]